MVINLLLLTPNLFGDYESYQEELRMRKQRRIAYGIQEGLERKQRLSFRRNYSMYVAQARIYSMQRPSVQVVNNRYYLDDNYNYRRYSNSEW